MRFREVHSAEELHRLVLEVGFLPFFKNEINGFSVEECTPFELWFSDTLDGPWEWKGPIIDMGNVAYGKLFQKKAGFVSMEWYPYLANYRRDGYDFDARFDDGMAQYKDRYLYETVQKQGAVLTGSLKELCNYKKGQNKGFETVITRLQMQTYVTIDTFTYKRDKQGNSYGWGVAKYTTPENKYGYHTVCSAYHEEPKASKEKLLAYLQKLMPDAEQKKRLKVIG